jgi:hypothetical protein
MFGDPNVMNRIFAALFLLAIVGFCAFGFLATFEPPGFVALRIGYGIATVFCLVGIAWLFRPKPHRS